MADVRVLCFSKHPRTDPNQGINHLGGARMEMDDKPSRSINREQNQQFLYLCGSNKSKHWRSQRPKRKICTDLC